MPSMMEATAPSIVTTGLDHHEGAVSTPCTLQVGAKPSAVYREYPAPPDLMPYVICAWTLEIGDGDQHHRQRVIADGCSDIVWIGDASPIVVGPMTRSTLSTTEAGTTLVGLRFRPEAAARVLGVAAHELADRRIPLNEVWSRRAVDDVCEQLWEQRTTAGRLAIVQQFVASRHDAIGAPDAAVQHTVSLLCVAPNERVGGLAKQVGISERHLRRRFVAAVGYSPKVFHRIVRFQRLLTLANASPPTRLHILASRAGYADQSHMTREVKEFAGVAPSALLGKVESALALSGMLGEEIQ
jgi:AraC-like DNA-binding protein